MKTLRTVLLIGCAILMLGMLVDIGTEATATTQPQLDSRELRVESGESGTAVDREQLSVYLDNKAEIDAAWATLADNASLADALDAWLARRGSPDPAETADRRSPAASGDLRSEQVARSETGHSAQPVAVVCTDGTCAVPRVRSAACGDCRFGFRVRAVGRFLGRVFRCRR